MYGYTARTTEPLTALRKVTRNIEALSQQRFVLFTVYLDTMYDGAPRVLLAVFHAFRDRQRQSFVTRRLCFAFSSFARSSGISKVGLGLLLVHERHLQ